MARELKGVIHGNRYYRIPEDAVALELARRGESTKGITLGYSEKKPGKSIAMRCHPDQVAMMNGLMKKHSISGVKYDKKGNCIITSRRARARAMPVFGRAVGLEICHDDDGGYSD